MARLLCAPCEYLRFSSIVTRSRRAVSFQARRMGWRGVAVSDESLGLRPRVQIRQLQMFLNENDETPFDALRYVTGECNYGGRVTDDKDRLLLATILEKCCCAELSEDPMYKLSSSGLYQAPDEGDRQSYMVSAGCYLPAHHGMLLVRYPPATLMPYAGGSLEPSAPDGAVLVAVAKLCLRRGTQDFIGELPIIPMPEAFGLHENADITKDQNDTADLFRSLLTTGGGGAGGAGGVSARRTCAKWGPRLHPTAWVVIAEQEQCLP